MLEIRRQNARAVKRRKMTKAKQLAEAKAHARRAELDALVAKVQLAIVEDKIIQRETAAARRQRILIQTAVERMVKSGAIHPADHFGQFRMTEQLIENPSLVPLALTKTIFRARPAMNQKSTEQ